MSSQGIAKGFHGVAEYAAQGSYELLPFRFLRLDESNYVATNQVGELVVLDQQVLHDLINKSLPRSTDIFSELQAKHFVHDGDSTLAQEMLAAKYRTLQAPLAEFTGLHLFVVTLQCDHSCPYCQVSRATRDSTEFDMSFETADKAIEVMFKSPASCLKVEFQGGEPLLRFDVLKYIVEEATKRNDGRDLEFVVATTLSLVTDEMLEFFSKHSVLVSTSLDGPGDLHNGNRPRPDRDSYERAIAGIQRARDYLGPKSVSALMTTTLESLEFPEEIVDEYIKLGFSSVFLRWISPYGFAVKTKRDKSYGTEEFVEFYKRGLDYILDLNKRGIPFCEEYSSIILGKMFSNYGSGYVDLQSPTGLGTSVLVYNYNGEVYASDEGRMLAEMGDKTFKLGDLDQSYEELFLSSGWLDIVLETMTEGLPRCSDCAFQPFCGTDPVFNHQTQGDMIGHRPTSEFCSRHMAIMKHLVCLINEDSENSQILRSWVRN